MIPVRENSEVVMKFTQVCDIHMIINDNHLQKNIFITIFIANITLIVIYFLQLLAGY